MRQAKSPIQAQTRPKRRATTMTSWQPCARACKWRRRPIRTAAKTNWTTCGLWQAHQTISGSGLPTYWRHAEACKARRLTRGHASRSTNCRSTSAKSPTNSVKTGLAARSSLPMTTRTCKLQRFSTASCVILSIWRTPTLPMTPPATTKSLTAKAISVC